MLMRETAYFLFCSGSSRCNSSVVPQGSGLFYGQFLWVPYFFPAGYAVYPTVFRLAEMFGIHRFRYDSLPTPNTASLIHVFSSRFQPFSRMETAGLFRKNHRFRPVPDRFRRPESSTWVPDDDP